MREGLLVVAVALIWFACEDVDLSTGPSGASGATELVQIENKSTHDLRVTIDACFQDFTMKSGSVKTIECTPQDGSNSFSVQVVRTDFEDATWSGTVSKGQVILILTDPWLSAYIEVEVQN